jgi:hypothetical protein
MDLFGHMERLITEHAAAAVLREHLALVRAQYDDVAKKHVALQQTHAETVARLAELEREITDWREREKFVEARGVLWKRKTEGGYHEVPYCPDCRLPLASEYPNVIFHCTTRCRYNSSIQSWQVPNILKGLP